MSTHTASVERTAPAEESLRVLARIEAIRFARHPLFIVGTVLLALTMSAAVDDRSSDAWQYSIFPAFFLGVFGCVVAYRLTRSTESSVEVMDAAPTPVPRRTAALCLACLVPGGVSLLFSAGLLVGLQVWPLADWQNPGFSNPEAFVLLVAQPMVACVGGPLVGVAAGRWWRFPGAGVLAAVLLIAAVILSFMGRGFSNPDVTLSTFLRMLSPMGMFSESLTTNLPVPWVMRYPGSPYSSSVGRLRCRAWPRWRP